MFGSYSFSTCISGPSSVQNSSCSMLLLNSVPHGKVHQRCLSLSSATAEGSSAEGLGDVWQLILPVVCFQCTVLCFRSFCQLVLILTVISNVILGQWWLREILYYYFSSPTHAISVATWAIFLWLNKRCFKKLTVFWSLALEKKEDNST